MWRRLCLYALLCGVVMAHCVHAGWCAGYIPKDELAKISVVFVTENISEPYSSINIGFGCLATHNNFKFVVGENIQNIAPKEIIASRIYMGTLAHYLIIERKIEIIRKGMRQNAESGNKANIMCGSMSSIEQNYLNFHPIPGLSILSDNGA